MSFLVEDGTGLSASNSLCSVADADSYFTDRANASWTGSTPAKEAALIRATDFFEARWGAALKGERLLSTQALSFPRLYIDQDGVVPQKIKYAVAEYALRTVSGTPLAADPSADASLRAARRVKEALDGVGSTEVEYFGSNAQWPSYPAADAYVRDFVRSTSKSYR